MARERQVVMNLVADTTCEPDDQSAILLTEPQEHWRQRCFETEETLFLEPFFDENPRPNTNNFTEQT